jgi:hypothetical protein
MSARALEFVEYWVSEKIEEMEDLPAAGDDATAKALAAECLQAAQSEGIPQAEIQEAFDDLAAFIGGEIEEARKRDEEDLDEDDDDSDDGKDKDEDEDADEDEDEDEDVDDDEDEEKDD